MLGQPERKISSKSAYLKRGIRQPQQMGEEVRNMPHPVFGRQEKSVLALGCNSVSSGSAFGANRNRRQTSAGKGSDV